jgi:hypothetical protein
MLEVPAGDHGREQQHGRHGEQVEGEHHADVGQVERLPAAPDGQRHEHPGDQLERHALARQVPRGAALARGGGEDERVRHSGEDQTDGHSEQRRVELLQSLHREHRAEGPQEGGGHAGQRILPAQAGLGAGIRDH